MLPPPLPSALAPSTVRDSRLDATRGLAILGLIFSNMPNLASADPYREWVSKPVIRETWAQVADFAIEWFVVGKCVALLSFLLGAGLALQQQAADAAAASFPRQTLRRMAALFGIGLLHILFLWFGDILCAYALMGFAFLIFYRLPATTLRWLAGIGMAVTVLILGIFSLIPNGEPDKEFTAWVEKVVAFIESAYQDGPFYKTLLVRLGEAAVFQGIMLFTIPFYLGIVLLGYDAIRSGWFPWQGRTWPRMLVAGMTATGLILCGIYAWVAVRSPDNSQISAISTTVGMPAFLILAGAYLYGLLRLPEGPIQRTLAAVGRTALSNYLLQSLGAAIVFHSWGFGQFGRLSTGEVFAVCLGIVALQLAWPQWWLRHFRFGPMEYLWRRLSYGSAAGSWRRK